MTTIPADQALPGDIVHGTWNDTYPQPRTVEAVTPSPEHSTTGPAYRLVFSDGTSKVYYGSCDLKVERAGQMFRKA